jgi:hypothetical protein
MRGGSGDHLRLADRGVSRISRTPNRDCPACALIKKPIWGQPKIGAHFVSFNFANSLICAIVSSVARGRPAIGWRWIRRSGVFEPHRLVPAVLSAAIPQQFPIASGNPLSIG